MKVADLDTGLLVAGPPCQPFSNLNDDKRGFEDPRSGGIAMFVQLVTMLRRIAPHIEWSSLMENVASMSEEDRATIREDHRRPW